MGLHSATSGYKELQELTEGYMRLQGVKMG